MITTTALIYTHLHVLHVLHVLHGKKTKISSLMQSLFSADTYGNKAHVHRIQAGSACGRCFI